VVRLINRGQTDYIWVEVFRLFRGNKLTRPILTVHSTCRKPLCACADSTNKLLTDELQLCMWCANRNSTVSVFSETSSTKDR